MFEASFLKGILLFNVCEHSIRITLLVSPLFVKIHNEFLNIVSLIFQLKALSHYTNEQIEVAVSFASKPEIVTNIRQRNIEVRTL